MVRRDPAVILAKRQERSIALHHRPLGVRPQVRVGHLKNDVVIDVLPFVPRIEKRLDGDRIIETLNEPDSLIPGPWEQPLIQKSRMETPLFPVVLVQYSKCKSNSAKSLRVV